MTSKYANLDGTAHKAPEGFRVAPGVVISRKRAVEIAREVANNPRLTAEQRRAEALSLARAYSSSGL